MGPIAMLGSTELNNQNVYEVVKTRSSLPAAAHALMHQYEEYNKDRTADNTYVLLLKDALHTSTA